jgi:uncharacterized GH25 family protein
MHRFILVWAGLLAAPLSAEAHEFWIEPQKYHASVNEDVPVELKVGQMLNGRSYPYLSHKIIAYQMTDGGGTSPLTGNEGDIPSVVYHAPTAGLHILSYHAAPESITYDEFTNFSEYLAEEGKGSLIGRHRERGLPERGFTETYSRNAKALIQIGGADPEDKDKAIGLPFELVAEENPYIVNSASIPVVLLWRGEPAPDEQIAVFRKKGKSEVTRTTFITDAEGKANIPLFGGGQFLLSAVHLEEVEAQGNVAWHSTWASLVFGLPESAGNAQ